MLGDFVYPFSVYFNILAMFRNKFSTLSRGQYLGFIFPHGGCQNIKEIPDYVYISFLMSMLYLKSAYMYNITFDKHTSNHEENSVIWKQNNVASYLLEVP